MFTDPRKDPGDEAFDAIPQNVKSSPRPVETRTNWVSHTISHLLILMLFWFPILLSCEIVAWGGGGGGIQCLYPFPSGDSEPETWMHELQPHVGFTGRIHDSLLTERLPDGAVAYFFPWGQRCHLFFFILPSVLPEVFFLSYCIKKWNPRNYLFQRKWKTKRFLVLVWIPAAVLGDCRFNKSMPKPSHLHNNMIRRA